MGNSKNTLRTFKKFSSPEPLDQFQPNVAQSILGWRWFNFFLNEGSCPSQSGDNCKIVKIHYWKLFLKFLLQNYWDIFNQTWCKASDSIFLYEGPTPSQRVEHYKIVQMHWQILKSSSQELLDKFYPNLSQSLLGWRGFIFL